MISIFKATIKFSVTSASIVSEFQCKFSGKKQDPFTSRLNGLLVLWHNCTLAFNIMAIMILNYFGLKIRLA